MYDELKTLFRKIDRLLEIAEEVGRADLQEVARGIRNDAEAIGAEAGWSDDMFGDEEEE